METIILYTRSGEEVTEVSIPEFTPPMDILLWGERYFVFNKEDGKYYEGVCFAVVE